MQWVWAHRLWPRSAMLTTDGQRVLVVNPGRQNRDAGPDFFNASVRIDRVAWAGDVEMHIRASDWHRHGHDGDPAYHTVILHVVERDDDTIRRPDGEAIPQLLMPCARDFEQQYRRWVDTPGDRLPCGTEISSLPPLLLADTLSSLAMERLQDKAVRVLHTLDSLQGDWQSTLYITVARGLGFNTNAEPFERLARSLPLRFMLKHANDITEVEALLFGQASLLPMEWPPSPDTYIGRLCREYAFLKAKFGLQPLQSPGWKMARMRPQNLPHRRIAALAAIIAGGMDVTGAILNADRVEDVEDAFDFALSPFWATHFNFTAGESPAAGRSLSRASQSTLLVNVAAPVIYAQAVRTGDHRLEDRAMALWEHLPAETNRHTRDFAACGLRCRNASHSQAVIQLKNQYCEPRKCLYCRLGHRLLSQKVMACTPTTTPTQP